jgi:hypothetical protein
MLGLRLSATAMAASFALAGLAFSAPASAKSVHHHHRHHQVQVDLYGDVYSSYDDDYGNDTFPNTVDHSTECINGYRWQRHNHDWYKTEAQDTLPLPCR